ncbi:hypothetical protein AB0O90_04750 [Microbacterium testaceum]|uniref:hypothetical protein n=1 Tax=Microbacterium testaceum TaxID=2033 RepID=UPI003425C15E
MASPAFRHDAAVLLAIIGRSERSLTPVRSVVGTWAVINVNVPSRKMIESAAAALQGAGLVVIDEEWRLRPTADGARLRRTPRRVSARELPSAIEKVLPPLIPDPSVVLPHEIYAAALDHHRHPKPLLPRWVTAPFRCAKKAEPRAAEPERAPVISKGPSTSTEFLAELAANPEFQRRRAAHEAEQSKRRAAFAAAEAPILKDLRAAGFAAESVWDFVNTSDPYPDALPILLAHLKRGGYPNRVMESLGRAVAVKPMVAHWDDLVALYQNPRSSGEETGVAVALAACATKAQFDELLSLAADDSRDSTRIFFLRTLKRIDRARGTAFVESRVEDPVLGPEATHLTKQAAAARRRRERRDG